MTANYSDLFYNGAIRDKQMDELKEKVGAAQKEVMRLQLEKQRLEKLLQAVRMHSCIKHV